MSNNNNYWVVAGQVPIQIENPPIESNINYDRPAIAPKEHNIECPTCGAGFDSKFKMERHQLKHSDIRNFPCTICTKAFKTKSNMLKHQKIHNTGPFNCNYCLLLFLRRKECENHMRICQARPISVKPVKPIQKKEFSCDICFKVFNKNSHLKRHKACVHENKRNFKCDYPGCVKAFNDVTDLGKHQKIVHLKIREAQCHLCNAQYPFKSLLQRHMKIAHDEFRNRYSCDLCTRSFHIKAKILKHMRTAHMKIPSGSCVCEHCGKIVSNSSILGHVLSVHLKQCPRDFRCEICSATFTTKNKLEYHHHHKHSDVRNFVCAACQKTFKTRSDLMQHQQMHDLIGPLQCTYCFEILKSQEEFDNHPNTCPNKPSKVRKIKKKEYICDVCFKQFTKVSHLKRHKICVHENKRNFKCDYPGCVKKFNDITDLGKHKKIVHFKFRHFKIECHLCDSKFAFQSSLTKHLKNHEDFGRKFSCDLCKLTFEAKAKLVRHMRAVHLKRRKRSQRSLIEIPEFEEHTFVQLAPDSTEIKEEQDSDYFEDPYEENNFLDSDLTFDNEIKVKEELAEEKDRSINDSELKIEIKEEEDPVEFKAEVSKELKENNEELKSEESDEEDHEELKAEDEDSEDEENDNHLKDNGNESDTSDNEAEETPINPKKRFKCKQCDKWYRKIGELTRHRSYVHEGRKDFVCSEENCQKTFAHEKSLKHHVSVHHSEQCVKIVCDECDKVFTDRDGLRKHQKSVHEGIRYSCNLCAKSFSRKSILNKHVDAKHINLKPPAPRAEKITRINCTDCGLLIWKTGLMRHKIRVHNYPVENVFECDFCGVQKQLRDDIVNHMKTNHMPKTRSKLPCDICGQQLANKKALRNHIKFIHEKIIQDICEFCGLGFLDRERYINHFRSKHTGEKPYKCTECDKAFSASSSLRNHRVYEHSKETSICEFCSKTFSNNRYLKNHQRTVHSIGTPHKRKSSSGGLPKKKPEPSKFPGFCCTFSGCGLWFSTSKKLKNHSEVHTGDRKHVCKICHSAYRKRDGLITHIRVIHLKWEVKCEVQNCGAKFVRKDFLRGHIKSTHTELSEQEVQYLFQRIEEIPLPSIQSYNDIAASTVE